MKTIKIFFWEFAQNVGPVVGFALAVDLWRLGHPWWAVLSAFVGGVTGALMIAATESRKVAGHHEPISVLIANIIAMTTFSCGVAIYFSMPWSTWLTDLFVGILVGILLGAAQSLAVREPIGVRHCIALGAAFPVVLILLRVLFGAGLPVLANIMIITTLMTLVIVLIDYTPAKK